MRVSNYNLLSKRNCKGFTLLELLATLVIIAVITSSVVIVMNKCLEATINYKLRGQAFQVARDNMENLLNTSALKESAEFGISEVFPAIQWEIVVEVFNEPIKSSMWLQARSLASYTDTEGELQTIEFTEWITALTGPQSDLVKDQRERELDALDSEDNPDSDLESDPESDPVPEPCDILADYTFKELLEMSEQERNELFARYARGEC